MIPTQSLTGYAIGSILLLLLLTCATCLGICMCMYPYIIAILAFPRGLTGYPPIKNTIIEIDDTSAEESVAVQEQETIMNIGDTSKLIDHKVTIDIGSKGYCKFAFISPEEIIPIDEETGNNDKVIVVFLSNNQDLQEEIKSYSQLTDSIRCRGFLLLQNPDFSQNSDINITSWARWRFVLRNYTESFIVEQLIDCVTYAATRFEIPWSSIYLCSIGLGASFALRIRAEISRLYDEIPPILLVSPCTGFLTISEHSFFTGYPNSITRLFDCGNLMDAMYLQPSKAGISVILVTGSHHFICKNSTIPKISLPTQLRAWIGIRGIINDASPTLLDSVTIVGRPNCQDDFETYIVGSIRKFLMGHPITNITTIPRWSGDITINY